MAVVNWISGILARTESLLPYWIAWFDILHTTIWSSCGTKTFWNCFKNVLKSSTAIIAIGVACSRWISLTNGINFGRRFIITPSWCQVAVMNAFPSYWTTLGLVTKTKVRRSNVSDIPQRGWSIVFWSGRKQRRVYFSDLIRQCTISILRRQPQVEKRYLNNWF